MKKILFFSFLMLFCFALLGVYNVNLNDNNEVLVQKNEIKKMKLSNNKRTNFLEMKRTVNQAKAIEVSIEETEQIDELILQCENNLNINGNSIEEELTNQIKDYESKLRTLQVDENQNYEQIQNVKNLINELYLMLEQYTTYTSNKLEGKIEVNTIQPYAVVVDPNDLLSLSYPAAHAAIVSYFSNRGYVLSAELLTHMKSNTSYDSVYKPVNSNIVYENEVFKKLAYNSQLRGSASFESGDLYMAIHAFNYSKSINNTAIVLTDRYDFAFSTSYDDFLTQSAVNMMVTAQQSGFLTPYYVIVEYSNNTNLNNNSNIKSFPVSNWRYSETMATLGKGDSIIYTILFSTSGYRNIQTFGYTDSYLTIQSSDGTYLTSNDDAGYERNALVNYYFNSGQTYRIVLRFYSSTTIGNVRIAITPSSYTNYDNITSLERTWSLFKTYYKNVEINNSAGQVSMFLLKPALSSSFTIQTTKKNEYVDTYLIYIDPRRADTDKDTDKPEYLKSCIANDDGAGNLQAKLSIGQHDCSIPYLIVAGTVSSTATGSYYLDINGLDSSHLLIL